MCRRDLPRLLGAVLVAAVVSAFGVPSLRAVRAATGDCTEAVEAADDLRALRAELEAEDVDRQTRHRLEQAAATLEEMGTLLASDEHAAPKDRTLGENLAAAAVSLEGAAPQANARQLHSVSGRALECVEALTKSCALDEESPDD